MFTEIVPKEKIKFSLGDARTVLIEFSTSVSGASVTGIFDAEDEHSGEQQKQGWRSILNNFRRHVEASYS